MANFNLQLNVDRLTKYANSLFFSRVSYLTQPSTLPNPLPLSYHAFLPYPTSPSRTENNPTPCPTPVSQPPRHNVPCHATISANDFTTRFRAARNPERTQHILVQCPTIIKRPHSTKATGHVYSIYILTSDRGCVCHTLWGSLW